MTPDAALVAPLLENEFLLDGGSGTYHREISSRWENSDDRIFGGYSAALSFAAAARESPHGTFCSGHVMFLEGVHAGRIELVVTPLRVGRSVAAMRVEGLQDGRRVLATAVWLRSAPTPDAPSGAILQAQGPDHGVPLAWLPNLFKFHQWLETRGIDYPSSVEAFGVDRKPSVDVWLRPKAQPLPAGMMTQLFDILVADAHISDCQLRASACDPAALVSLDLAIQWTSVLHRPGWRRMQAFTPPVADGSAACVATISDETGFTCATAAQQTWIIRRKTPAATG
jgi:acyl-CoA thioesterase